MIFDDLSLKRADNVLQELYSRFDSGDVEPGTIEAAALIFSHIISHFQESYYRPHLESIGRLLIASLDSARIESLGYNALLALSRILTKSKELFPERIPEDFDATIKLIRTSLAKQCMTAGAKDKAREHLEIAGLENVSAAINNMRKEIEASTESQGAGSVSIPVTHQPLSSLPSLITGQVIQGELDIEITGEWSILRRRKPVIAFDGKILESHGPFARQLRAAAAVAEDIFIYGNRQRELARLPRQYMFSFADPDAETKQTRAYTGGSAGLGFALLTLDRLDRLGFRRRQRRLKSRIAVTGYLGPEGSILPVDNAGIAAKLQAVFFSVCTHFAIPEENRAAADAVLAKLHEEFPDRRLEIVPVSSVAEAYQDDRIFESTRASAGTVALKKMGRKRKYLVASLSLLAAIIVMLLLIPPMFTKEISTFYVENDVLHFVNRFGVVFDTFTPGYHIYKCENKEPGLLPGLITQREDSPPVYAYNGFHEDIILGGEKEFLFIALAVDPTEKNPAGKIHIHLLSHSREPLLHITLSDTLRMLEGGKPVEHTKVNLLWNGLFDFDHNGRKELYVIARNHVLSPTVVHRISFVDKSVQTFAHYGYFDAFRIYDYNGDGCDEILLAGVHGDPLNKGVALVLDPLDMQGTTPTGLDPSFVDYDNDAALLYIMFPQSVMCDLLEGDCSRPHVTTINPVGNGTIWFGVLEGGPGLMYYFDSSWRCNNVEFITAYISKYKALMKIHDLKPMDEYKEELRAEVCYWDGNNWIASPP